MTVLEISPSAPDLRPLSATCSAGWDCCTVAMAHSSWQLPGRSTGPGTACVARQRRHRVPRIRYPGATDPGPLCHGSSTYRAHLATISVVTGVYHDWSRPCQPALGLGSTSERAAGRGAVWTEERGTSDEGRRRREAPRRQAGDTACASAGYCWPAPPPRPRQFAGPRQGEERGTWCGGVRGVRGGVPDWCPRTRAYPVLGESGVWGGGAGPRRGGAGHDFAPPFGSGTRMGGCPNPPVIWEKERG